MWEWFTSKPKVVAGECKYLGDGCLTPWPCFSIAATDATVADTEKMATLDSIFKGLGE